MFADYIEPLHLWLQRIKSITIIPTAAAPFFNILEVPLHPKYTIIFAHIKIPHNLQAKYMEYWNQIWLYSFAAKDGKALYSQQKQDQELTVAQIMNSLLPNSDWNWRKGENH